MTTLATLDGSLRTTELGTLEAIELCERIARTLGHAARNIPAWATIAANTIDALDSYQLTQLDDELTASCAREELDALMRETTDAMYELGYLAYWDESWFYIEIDDDESETDQ